jgi:hypothetical protein
MQRFTWTLSQVAVYARSIKPAMCEGRISALRFCIVLGLTSMESTQFLELLPPFLLHMTLIYRRTRTLTQRAWPKLGHLSLRLLTLQHIHVQGYNEAILLQRIFSAWLEASASDYTWSSPRKMALLSRGCKNPLDAEHGMLLVSRAGSGDVLSRSALT